MKRLTYWACNFATLDRQAMTQSEKIQTERKGFRLRAVV
jgi:hypothetical protein